MAWDKTRWRTEQAIRLELTNLGLSDSQIAEQIGLSLSGYNSLKNRPEYRILKTAMLTQVTCELDAEMAIDIQGLREKLLTVGVPLALDTLIFYASQRSEPKIAIEAAKQILNREGHLSEVSKSQVILDPLKDGLSLKDEEMATELITALDAVKAAKAAKEAGASKVATATIQ